jgi:nitrogen fixation/metabolism regulation signal transduction histidine kinase
VDEHFLRSLAPPPGVRALLYRNLEPEVSRLQLVGAAGTVALAAPFEPLIGRVRDLGQEVRENVHLPDGPETVHALPLKGRDGSVLGVLLAASSGRERAALVRTIRWTGAGLGAVGVLAGLALSYALATRVTQPVERLAEGARAVADGDWNVRLDVHASGEIGELAGAFDAMTRQLAEQRERLVQAERVAAWRELARRLAHELRNPLFPLRLTIDNLQRAKRDHPQEFDEVFDESLTTLSAGLGNLNAVIARFSDFARMPAPTFEPAEPNVIVERALQLFDAQLRAPGRPPIAVTKDLDRHLGAIHVDAEQLGRAVQNLVLNAIDAMPDGGTLTVRTTRAGDVVRLEVADTGEGLTDEERDRLFTPYYTTKQHGTGLGLAIVQSVVADHGGRIWVESARDRGTTFHIELRCSPRGA